MRYQYLSFAGGVGLFQLTPSVPSPAFYGMLFPMLWCLRIWRKQRYFALLACGFLWAMFRADLALRTRLPAQFADQAIEVIGSVSEISSPGQLARQFEFEVANASTYGGQALKLSTLKLAWYSREAPREPGVVCRLMVRLQLAIGKRNLGVFDREKCLFTKRISAVGDVIEHPSNACSGTSKHWQLSRIRHAIRASIVAAFERSEDRAIVLALGIADRSALSDGHWKVLGAAGTAHLFAISGLHISLVAVATAALLY